MMYITLITLIQSKLLIREGRWLQCYLLAAGDNQLLEMSTLKEEPFLEAMHRIYAISIHNERMLRCMDGVSKREGGF